MLNKEICKRCQNEYYSNRKERKVWSYKPNEFIKDCQSKYEETFCINISMWIPMETEPPISCKYKLEHTILNQK